MGISKICATTFKPHYTEYVYSLRSPINWQIFYVGKTQSMNMRFGQHLGEAKKNPLKTAKNTIINEILSEGLCPIMREIDKTYVRTSLDKYHAAYKEVFWIKFYNEIGWNLVNVKDINADLECFDYSRYIRKISQRKYNDYFFRKDADGNDIYDLKRLSMDGYAPPEEKKPEEEWKPSWNENFISFGGYNPYKNPRWREKVDLPPLTLEKYTYDYTYYKDTDPNYYDNDYYDY